MTLREIALIIVAIVFFVAYHYIVVPGVESNEKLRTQLIEAQEKLKDQTEELEALKKEYRDFQRGDLNVIERVLRDKYHYVRDGEKIIVFEGTKQKDTQDQTPSADNK